MEIQRITPKENLFSVQYVAERFGITSTAVSSWLRFHTDFTNNTDYIRVNGKGGRAQRYFTEKGMVVYTTMRDGIKGNRFQRNSERKDSIDLQNKKELFASNSYELRKQQILQQDPTLMTLQIMMDIKTDNLALAEEAKRLRDDIGNLQEQMRSIQQRSQQAVEELSMIEAPTVLLPEIGKGIRVRELVNKYCKANGVQQSFAYAKLYQESYYRLQYNIDQRRKKSGLTGIQQAEKDGKIEELYALAVKLFT